jgi:hypothetical protein
MPNFKNSERRLMIGLLGSKFHLPNNSQSKHSQAFIEGYIAMFLKIYPPMVCISLHGLFPTDHDIQYPALVSYE